MDSTRVSERAKCQSRWKRATSRATIGGSVGSSPGYPDEDISEQAVSGDGCSSFSRRRDPALTHKVACSIYSARTVELV